MKFKKLIKNIDENARIRIYIVYADYDESNDDEPAFEGYAGDAPWCMLEYRLIKPEENCDSPAICPFVDKNGYPCLRITLYAE